MVNYYTAEPSIYQGGKVNIRTKSKQPKKKLWRYQGAIKAITRHGAKSLERKRKCWRWAQHPTFSVDEFAHCWTAWGKLQKSWHKAAKLCFSQAHRWNSQRLEIRYFKGAKTWGTKPKGKGNVPCALMHSMSPIRFIFKWLSWGRGVTGWWERID